MPISTLQLMVAVAVGSSALTFSLTWLYMQVRHLRERVRALEAEHKPEAPATRKRMPYEAAEEVIDAVAVLDAMREKRMLEVEHYDNVKAHLVKALQTGTLAAHAARTGDAASTAARGAKRAGTVEIARDESEL